MPVRAMFAVYGFITAAWLSEIAKKIYYASQGIPYLRRNEEEVALEWLEGLTGRRFDEL